MSIYLKRGWFIMIGESVFFSKKLIKIWQIWNNSYNIYVRYLNFNTLTMWKFWNRLDNTISIPSRLIHTTVQGGIDILNTLDGLPKDATSVILSTKNKIADLFSKDLERYKYIWNLPVAAWVWILWGVEAFAKPIVNGVLNTWKTVVNFVSNARKSTFWSLFSVKPVSDISFNNIKIKSKIFHIDKTFNIDTTKAERDRDSLRTKNWWFLTEEKRKEILQKKKEKLEAKIRELWAAA